MKNSSTAFYRDRVIWITGASSGIGGALAEELLRAGAQLIVSGRNRDALVALQRRWPQQVRLLPFDIGDAEQRSAATTVIQSMTDYLDMAILNAGTCEYVDVTHFDPRICSNMMRVNFEGTCHCVAMALPLLRSGKERDPKGVTQLVVVGSMAAYTGLPRAEAYGASKAAVNYLLSSLRVDLHSTGIEVVGINPGFIKTPLTDRNDFAMPFLKSSEDAAAYVAGAIAKRKQEINFPPQLHWLLKVVASLPEGWRINLLQRLVRVGG